MIKSIERVFKVQLFLIISLMLMRVGWFIKSMPSDISSYGLGNILYAFFLGLRFDLVTSAYAVLIPFLLIPLLYFFSENIKKRILFIALYLFTLLVILINSFDLGFYNFFNDHINLLFFGLFEDDTQAIFKTIWKNYNVPLLSLLILIGFVGHFFVFKKVYNSKCSSKIKANALTSTSIYFLSFILLVALGRGKFGPKPFSYEDSAFSNSTFINQIGINGVFSLYRASKVRSKFSDKNFSLVKEMGFKGKELDIFKNLYNKDVKSIKDGLKLLESTTPKNTYLESNPPNVVVIMVESFGSYWLKYQSEQFNLLDKLKSHMDEDLHFENFTSPANGTIGSLVSLITGQISLPSSVVLSEGRYSFNKIKSSIHLPYKANGYQTLFGYGGKLGWRGIGKYVKRQGYDEVFGQSLIASKVKSDNIGNEWGVFDENLYSVMFDKISSSTKPTFMLSMTTSNHPPYDIPNNYEGSSLVFPDDMKARFVKDEEYSLKRFKAFQYSNNMLANFITKIKSSKLGENTFVIFTGDHNFWDIFRFEENETYLKRKVPLYMYIPPKYKKADYTKYLNKFSTTIDLMPTIYPLTLSDSSYISLGKNLFSNDKTYSLNSSKLIANREGAFIENNSYIWSDRPGEFLSRVKQDEQKSLDLIYRSFVSVNELLIRASKL